jgi:tRNA pseudouridine55 synthase
MTTMKIHDFHGWLMLDKPQGLSSARAMGLIKKHWNHIKTGHGGTLDPFATGLLPIAFGEATKTSAYVMGNEKRYLFTVRWGQETDTLDSEGAIQKTASLLPSPQDIQDILPSWTGEIMQTPPIYSAIKVGGKRAYHLARRGETPLLSPRKVHIRDLSFLRAPDERHACFSMVCGKGVYVRALARDLARALGTYATVVQLRRTHIGFFSLQDSLSLEHILKTPYSAIRGAACVPLGRAFFSLDRMFSDFPSLELNPERALGWRQGKSVAMVQVRDLRGDFSLDRISGDATSRGSISEDSTSRDGVSEDSTSRDGVSEGSTSRDSVSEGNNARDGTSGGSNARDGVSKDKKEKHTREEKENPLSSHPHLNPIHHDKNYAVWTRGQVIGIARCETGFLRVQCIFNRPTRPLHEKGTL